MRQKVLRLQEKKNMLINIDANCKEKKILALKGKSLENFMAGGGTLF